MENFKFLKPYYCLYPEVNQYTLVKGRRKKDANRRPSSSFCFAIGVTTTADKFMLCIPLIRIHRLER